jgi:glycerate kinase
MRVLVCPDAFRGTMTAPQAAGSFARGWRRARPSDELDLAPMADGGEGTLDALCREGRIERHRVAGPLGDPVDAGLGFLPGGASVVESAQAAGIALLAPERRDPLRATTRGVGELIRVAMDEGARSILVCLGGSATNDGGAGLASALGARFSGTGGRVVPDGGAALRDLARIDLSGLDPRLRSTAIIGLTDVDDPLCGPTGASVTYGPQKGATPDDVVLLDRALAHLAATSERDLGVRLADEPGAGAAGGLGFGLMAFCGAHLRRGVEAVADAVDLEAKVARADLVVTGEGAVDATSLRGKVVGHVVALARLATTRVVVVGGRAEIDLEGIEVRTLVDAVGEERALDEARASLERVAATLAEQIGAHV